MKNQPEPDGVADDIDPEMTPRVASSPLQQQDGLVFLEPTSAFQVSFINLLQHLRQAAFAQHLLRVLARGFIVINGTICL